MTQETTTNLRPVPSDREIPATNEIVHYMHCAKCLAEMPPDTTPKEWARTQSGFTARGIQVWCDRHDCNIVHIDFLGQKFPANTKAAP